MISEPEMVGEVQRLVGQSLAPRREPTAAEAAARLPVLAQYLDDQRAAGAQLEPQVASAVVGACAAKVLDLRVREVLSQALAENASKRPRGRGRRRRTYDAFGLTLDA
ncbi:MAG TPA: hypothetical protein VJT67_13220 [Longimicrobiaceae bacterium]|nr:hypothetical protein [Longimicrobiaceae bacterium]